jgi:putative transposase
MRFRVVEAERAEHAISRLCTVLGVTRQGFYASAERLVASGDITYVPTLEGWLFLGIVMDIYSRKIVGWSMRDNLEADLVVDALAMAVTRRKPSGRLIHHSDRGSQYTSLAFGKTVRESGVVASMGSRGDAYDNAACESCISTLKEEWIKRHRYQSRDEARLSIFQYIETFYNPRRRHSSLAGISPDQYELSCLNGLHQERNNTIETTSST